jgi:hypothetical protein
MPVPERALAAAAVAVGGAERLGVDLEADRAAAAATGEREEASADPTGGSAG